MLFPSRECSTAGTHFEPRAPEDTLKAPALRSLIYARNLSGLANEGPTSHMNNEGPTSLRLGPSRIFAVASCLACQALGVLPPSSSSWLQAPPPPAPANPERTKKELRGSLCESL